MADRKVARRYAKAFLSAAEEVGATDALLADLLRFQAAAAQNDRELFRALANPVFTLDERKAVLDVVVLKLGVHPLTCNLLMVLLDKGRFAELHFLAEEYHAMADVRAGRARVSVETATPMGRVLEDAVRAALERVTGKQVILETRTNPDLIGGMVARVGSKVYDASVRARLDDIRQRLIHSQAPAEA